MTNERDLAGFGRSQAALAERRERRWRRRQAAERLAILLSLALHAGAGLYVWSIRVAPHWREAPDPPAVTLYLQPLPEQAPRAAQPVVAKTKSLAPAGPPTAAVAPPAGPALPQPQTPLQARETAASDAALPQGAGQEGAGDAEAKGGRAGGEGGGLVIGGPEACGGASLYLTMIATQLKDIFGSNKALAKRDFDLAATVWFASAGNLERVNLARSTGDPAFDQMLAGLLTRINVGANFPTCLQAFRIHVYQSPKGLRLTPDDGRRDPSKTRSVSWTRFGE